MRGRLMTIALLSNGQLFNTNQVSMSGTNVGDLMGDQGSRGKGITWGWFMGGFAPTTPYNPPTGALAVCGSAGTGTVRLRGRASVRITSAPSATTSLTTSHSNIYTSSANPHHLPPTSTSMIGKTDQANHQYDLSTFFRL